ncbi:MAG TPA: glutamine synthetase III, partial [Gemmataceae bacterium]|nr:glutamine synthetase III [Gemmataceae bacterium]
MSNKTVRQAAVQAIASARHHLQRVNFKEKQVKDLFGENVFNEVVQRERLPKPVFKILQKTIKQGATLDPAIADAVATAMKDWAIEK